MTDSLMTGEPPLLTGLIRTLSFLSQGALIYASLITVIALTAVFASRPSRRRAALQVLRLLLPGRRRHDDPSP